MGGVSGTTTQTAKTFSGNIESETKLVATDSSGEEILSVTFPKAAIYFYFNYKSSFTITLYGTEITLSNASSQSQGGQGCPGEQGGQGGPGEQGGQTPPSDQGGQGGPGEQGGQTPPSDQGSQGSPGEQGGQTPPSDQGSQGDQVNKEDKAQVLDQVQIPLVMTIHHILQYLPTQIYQVKQYQVRQMDKVQYI